MGLICQKLDFENNNYSWDIAISCLFRKGSRILRMGPYMCSNPLPNSLH